jgi:hypothetical protein
MLGDPDCAGDFILGQAGIRAVSIYRDGWDEKLFEDMPMSVAGVAAAAGMSAAAAAVVVVVVVVVAVAVAAVGDSAKERYRCIYQYSYHMARALF